MVPPSVLLPVLSSVQGLPLAQASTAAVGLDIFNPTIFAGVLIVGIGGLLYVVNQAADVIDRFRRKPPIDKELADLVRRAELDAVDARLTTEIADQRRHLSASSEKIYKRIEEESRQTRDAVTTLGRSIDVEFRTLYRALGKVEGVTLEDPRRE